MDHQHGARVVLHAVADDVIQGFRSSALMVFHQSRLPHARLVDHVHNPRKDNGAVEVRHLAPRAGWSRQHPIRISPLAHGEGGRGTERVGPVRDPGERP